MNVVMEMTSVLFSRNSFLASTACKDILLTIRPLLCYVSRTTLEEMPDLEKGWPGLKGNMASGHVVGYLLLFLS